LLFRPLCLPLLLFKLLAFPGGPLEKVVEFLPMSYKETVGIRGRRVSISVHDLVRASTKILIETYLLGLVVVVLRFVVVGPAVPDLVALDLLLQPTQLLMLPPLLLELVRADPFPLEAILDFVLRVLQLGQLVAGASECLVDALH